MVPFFLPMGPHFPAAEAAKARIRVNAKRKLRRAGCPVHNDATNGELVSLMRFTNRNGDDAK